MVRLMTAHALKSTMHIFEPWIVITCLSFCKLERNRVERVRNRLCWSMVMEFTRMRTLLRTELMMPHNWGGSRSTGPHSLNSSLNLLNPHRCVRSSVEAVTVSNLLPVRLTCIFETYGAWILCAIIAGLFLGTAFVVKIQSAATSVTPSIQILSINIQRLIHSVILVRV